MLIKIGEGVYKREEDVNPKDIYEKVSIENTYIIKNFFNEEFFGVFEKETVSFINTKIKLN